MVTHWRRIASWIALTLFGMSAAVHLATFLPFPLNTHAPMPAVFGLHLAIFPLHFAMLIDARIRLAGQRVTTQALLRSVPRRTRMILWIVFGYALLNFAVGMAGLTSVVSGLRLFSGHWMMFYLAQTLYFRYPPGPESAPRGGAG